MRKRMIQMLAAVVAVIGVLGFVERHLRQRAAALQREVARGEPAIGDGVERGCRGHGRSPWSGLSG